MKAISMVHIGKIVEYIESQIDVHLIQSASIFSELTDLLLL
jgi:hypothetical protein